MSEQRDSPSKRPTESRPTLPKSNSGTITTLKQHSRNSSHNSQSHSNHNSSSTAMSQDGHSASLLPPAPSGEPIACNGCKLGLEETSDSVVVSFGSSLWHVDCFRCAKCSNLVEHDTNLLLLSDGSPVCENCSYICSVCQKPISNEAIVTGDESYHADCFRCRSCSNKIEELIFAKTSQGIWCMSCHNERVARSRKHAEAKRSRTVRKEKESRSGKNRPDRERSNIVVDSPASASGAFDLADLNNGLPSPNGPSTSGTLDTRQYRPPPPLASTSTASTGVGSSRSAAAPLRRPRTADSSSAHNEHAYAHLGRDSPSSNSISSLGRNTAPLSLPASTSNTKGIHESARVHSDLNEFAEHSNDREREEPRRRSVSQTLQENTEPTSPFDPPAQYASRDSDSAALSHESDQSRTESLNAPTPVDKITNRRSGFYGAMARTAASEEAGASSSGAVLERASSPSVGHYFVQESEVIDGQPHSPVTPPIPSITSTSTSTASFLPELHKSMSFYDPDTLLFLDHVASESSPTSNSLRRRSHSYKNGISHLNSDQVEHLSPDIGPGDAESSDDDFRSDRRPRSEVSQKVRESIGRSRGEGSEQGMGMNVDLVEMLLAELDGTKNEMQALQTKYNAFRRASRSAFEGFSMAQQEYDKEVSARREAESKMNLLRVRFTEQALKLAAVDKEAKVSKALDRRSKELRSSVVGMEKHLSKLRAEVELSTAQVEELGAIDRDESASDVDRASLSHLEIARSLNARLEVVKDQHRREIELLIKERDELITEVAELHKTREIYIDETTMLNRQNHLLADQNAEAGRQLDVTKDSMNKLRTPSPLAAPPRGHQYTSSTASGFVGAPISLPRSPLAVSRSKAPSPNLQDHDVELVHRQAEAHPAVVKKFKWGKAKVETNRIGSNQGSAVARVAAASLNSASRSSGSSSDLSSRTHIFQQTSILRPVKCEYCGDKMWGLNEVRCTVCGCYTHAKCAGYLATACNAHAPSASDEALAGNPNGHVMFGCDLTLQAGLEGRQVPIVVSKCIEAVEAFGMNYEGVYRKSGGNGQTKLITQHFERGQDFDLQDLDKFNDLAAVTSCMKNFFRSLPDPLFTYDLHEAFVSCTELPDGDTKLVAVEATLYDLPEVHFYTARMLIGHLHRVHLDSAENKMTPANLGVVFGPTVFRSRDSSREFSDMGSKAKLVELFVENYPRLFERPYSHDS